MNRQSDETQVLDADAASVLNTALPVDRLVDAALSDALPTRLRRRVAMAALTRALALKRPDVVARLRPTLHALATTLDADLARYAAAATPADQESAATLLLLNTPGASIDVRAGDDDYSVRVVEPAREFNHVFQGNWWCTERPQRVPNSATTRMLYLAQSPPVPAFVTDAERTTAARERKTIVDLGPPRIWLAQSALTMASRKPADPLAAGALARVVDGWRWSCGEDKSDPPLPQRAFVALHRIFPDSDAARRTKYWYRD